VKDKIVSVIIPTLNEEGGIVNTILSIPKDKLKEQGYEVQILVIDGNSQDKTANLAEAVGAEVIYESERGIGIATMTGFREAKGDIVVTADGDGTYPLETLPHLLRYFTEYNIDFLTTDRLSFCNGTMSLRNKLGNKALSQIFRMLFGISIKDSQSGMMIFKKSLLDKLQLKEDISLSQEMKIEACYFEDCNWVEMPILYHKRVGDTKLTGGITGWKVGTENLVHLFKKRIKR